MALPHLGVKSRAWFLLSTLTAITVVSCDREVTQPQRSRLSPRQSRHADVVPAPTYPHPDRGCYLWGPDPLYNPWQSYGDPTPLTVCGVTVSMEATDHDGFIDTTVVWFRPIPDPNTPQGSANGTMWQGGPANGAPIGGTGPVFAHFSQPVRDVHVVPWCALQPGDSVIAYGASGNVLEAHTIPVTGACPAAAPEIVLTSTNIWTVKVDPARPIVNQSWQGAFELWFTPMPVPHLVLTASKTSGLVADTITYTASSSDGSALTITSWTWRADAMPPRAYRPKLSWTNCRTSNPCRDTPGASGTMTVYGRVGGVASSDSQHVTMTIKPCPPDGDPILDSTDVRKGGKDAWAASKADLDSIVANHAEYTWGVYRMADGSLIAQQVSFAGTPCGSNPAIPLTVGSAVLVATIHPHPFFTGQTYPPSCGSMAGDKYNPATSTAIFGGRVSTEDWQSALQLSNQAGRPIPGYMIDYDGVYRYDATVAGIQELSNGVIVITKPNAAGLYKSWPRWDASRSCGRP